MNKIVLFTLFLFTIKGSILTSKNYKSNSQNFSPLENPENKRDLFLTTAYNAEEKQYDQTERIKTEYHKQYRQMMNGFNFRNQLEKVNEQNLEQVHVTYAKLVNNIKKAKNFLGDRMENIYNNFIMPGKWFY